MFVSVDTLFPVEVSFSIIVEESSPFVTMEFEFQHRSNLISFQGIPSDSSVSSILSPLEDNAIALIGQSMATSQISDDLWIGSLQNVEPTSGYWIKLEDLVENATKGTNIDLKGLIDNSINHTTGNTTNVPIINIP